MGHTQVEERRLLSETQEKALYPVPRFFSTGAAFLPNAGQLNHFARLISRRAYATTA
jgi:hypothetical protein